jgi:hypothetical protein
MATITEERARLQWLESKGRGHEKAHVILIEEEAKKRQENTGDNPKTRFQLETDDPEMYSRFALQKDRWLRLIPNKSVAIDMMCRMWEEPKDDVIMAFGADDAET